MTALMDLRTSLTNALNTGRVMRNLNAQPTIVAEISEGFDNWVERDFTPHQPH